MNNRDKSVEYIKGIGEKRAQALARLGIFTLGDLISYFPRAYEDRTVLYSIADAPTARPVCVRAMAADRPTTAHIRKNLDLTKLRVVDERSSMEITFFNQPYLRSSLEKGQSYIFYGRVNQNGRYRTMASPLVEAEGAKNATAGRIVPVYRLTAGVNNRFMMAAVQNGLLACGDDFPDALPPSLAERRELAQAHFSYENIHNPRSEEALAQAKRRLVYEELFVLSCALAAIRSQTAEKAGLRFCPYPPEEFYARLPYPPTGAQRRAIEEIFADMTGGRPMSRLLQGDVGSGKTLVAAAALWLCAANGYQAAFMAPTELLAQQHFKTLTGLLLPFGLRVVCLTGGMPARERRAVLAAMADGSADIVVGTHALIGEDAVYARLGLVIADEQHRFGVHQRRALAQKGQTPHMLVMSATPIPRTMALIIYGELDISVLDELPPGRQKVDTFRIREDYRPRLNNFIRKNVAEGRQVYIVCPMVEDTEDTDPLLKTAQRYAAQLQKQDFPDLRVGCVFGKLKGKEKIMAAFAAGELDILVSTTVIEVGVDVPNATLMIVENADRFGLSQLHQLRGRVGRGQHKSYCILVSDNNSDETNRRLEALCKTNDGFKISDYDLQMRGPGDFLGKRQHGLPEMRVANFSTDYSVLKQAQADAEELIRRDPELRQPENRELKKRVARLWEENRNTLN